MKMKMENKVFVKKRDRLTTWKDIVAKIEEGHKWEGNILQKMAEEIARYSIPIEEIVKIDLSVKLLKELEREVKNKEIISLQINSKPRLGKSTLGILLGKFIYDTLKKYEMKKKEDVFGMDNIARDQNEKVKKMRNPDLMYDVIVTDESNALEDTGENATVEKAQRDVFSDVQAGRYVHGIWVCPDGIMDKNTDIKLEVRNKDKGLIHTRVSYHLRTSFYEGWVLIGVADFDVTELIRQWLLVEGRFMRYLKEKREDDRKYVEYWAKRDFYVQYMCKKYEKMELMNREGILHARDLDYAEIRQTVINSLKELAKLTIIPIQRLRSNVIAKIEMEFRRRKMPLSIIGRSGEFERVMSMINTYRSLTEVKQNINSLKVRYAKGKIKEDEFNKTATILKKAEEELENEIRESEEQLDRLVRLNAKYNTHKEII